MKEGDQNGQALAYLDSNRPRVHLGMGTLEYHGLSAKPNVLPILHGKQQTTCRVWLGL